MPIDLILRNDDGAKCCLDVDPVLQIVMHEIPSDIEAPWGICSTSMAELNAVASVVMQMIVNDPDVSSSI